MIQISMRSMIERHEERGRDKLYFGTNVGVRIAGVCQHR